MGIFEKTVTAIEAADLQAHIGVPESAILEYKQAVHTWDDIVKELVAFANTFGGDLILGAEDDGAGRLKALPGIDPVNGFQQKITDLCFTGVVPALTPFSSPAIALPATSKVAYVVHVPASYTGPHFLVNRGGAYVRVLEHSKKYEPRLAEWGELIHLANRRQRAIDQRAWLLRRARERAAPLLSPNAVAMEFFACPSFPVQPIVQLPRLREVAVDPNAPAMRAHAITHDVVAAADSITCSRMRVDELGLYHELTTYGSTHTVTPIGRRPPGRTAGPLTAELLGVLTNGLLWLAHARFVLQQFGYDGPVTATLALHHVSGNIFVWSSVVSTFGFGPSAEPKFDQVVAQELETTTAAWPANLRTDALSLFLPIAYATDMREILNADRAQLVQQAVDRLAPHGLTIP